MKVPTVHLNGTSQGCLLEQWTDVSASLRTVLGALAEAAPNGRDYYGRGPAALGEATAEHSSRVRRVEELKAESDAMALAIADQDDIGGNTA